jgi:rubrerythrin
MYPEFERIAKEEGFDDVAEVFHEIAEVEEYHEERFLALKANIEQGKVFKRDEVVEWKCRNCGYIHKGTEPPKNCPACGYPQNYYELRAKNW